MLPYQFVEEVKHRQAERDYSSSLTQRQRYILRELRTLFNFTENEEQKEQINVLDRIFRNLLPQAINRELNALRRNGTKGQICLIIYYKFIINTICTGVAIAIIQNQNRNLFQY